MKIAAFQGETGAFSEEAVGALLPSFRPTAYPSFELVFSALMEGDVDAAVIPIENSLFGSVHVNYDLLLEHEVEIVAEVYLRIRHNLLVNPGGEMSDIRTVVSHPQALGQCKTFLRDQLPHAEQVAVYDTAGAAKQLARDRSRDVAAIASLKSADVYNLDVLAECIESNHQNYTRFLALSRGEGRVGQRGRAAKTSIVYALGHTVAGSLFKALALFADRDVDLLKIESRPLIGHPGSYLFYLDLDGHDTDEGVAAALLDLAEMADFVRVLGSYPRGFWVDGSRIDDAPTVA